MLEIEVKIIQHNEQRYDTVGDWWFSSEKLDGRIMWETLQVRVSRMNNENYEFLVARHEIDEAMLCRARGIKEALVTRFDTTFEKLRKAQPEKFQGEPGDHADAPYRKEHFFATTQERAMAAELGVDWEEYDEAVNSLSF
jgi:hypothetical protein